MHFEQARAVSPVMRGEIKQASKQIVSLLARLGNSLFWIIHITISNLSQKAD